MQPVIMHFLVHSDNYLKEQKHENIKQQQTNKNEQLNNFKRHTLYIRNNKEEKINKKDNTQLLTSMM